MMYEKYPRFISLIPANSVKRIAIPATIPKSSSYWLRIKPNPIVIRPILIAVKVPLNSFEGLFIGAISISSPFKILSLSS